MKRVILFMTVTVLAVASTSVLANQSFGDQIVFKECKDGLAAPGVDPRTTPKNDCWNPNKGRVATPNRSMMHQPMMRHNMNNPTMGARPNFNRAPVSAMVQPKLPTRSIRLRTVQGAQFIESEHNPKCYTFNFSGTLYQFCF